jgi:hypothetical protein
MSVFTTRITLRLALTTALVILTSTAMASPRCTDAPKTQWLSADQIRHMFQSMGFKDDVRKLQVSSGLCWEIEGTNKDGQKVEVYFHPITGTVLALNRKKESPQRDQAICHQPYAAPVAAMAR